MHYRLTQIKDFFLYDIKYGIQNLIKWFPIIWKDRNWDHTFIYIIMRNKLHFTEQLIRNHGNHVRNIKDANDIKLCVDILDRLSKDDYYEHAFKRHEEKWGEAQHRFEDCDESPEYQSFHIDYPNVTSEKTKKLQKRDFRRSCKHEANLREQDLDMLFTYMRKHIQGWWD